MHKGNSFSSQTLAKRLFNFQNDRFGQFWLSESALRKQVSQEGGPQGETVSYLIVHQRSSENREFLSHVYVKWQTSVSSSWEHVHMLVWSTSLATCTGDASLKNLTVSKRGVCVS